MLENNSKNTEEKTEEKNEENSNEKKELIEELLDNQFTFGLFTLSKYEKMAEKNPKKAFMRLFIPVLIAAIFVLLVFWIYPYVHK